MTTFLSQYRGKDFFTRSYKEFDYDRFLSNLLRYKSNYQLSKESSIFYSTLYSKKLSAFRTLSVGVRLVESFSAKRAYKFNVRIVVSPVEKTL